MQSVTITPYDKAFFDNQVDESLCAARAVIPVVLRLLPATSAVDFGCGRGTWLKICLENGVETVLGLDGDYVQRDKLLIGPEQFRSVDLELPVRLDRQFDLALCLEVAEHLPARSAPALVESLAAAAPVILFSAALPEQGGVSHVNEQWPKYWEDLFAAQGMRKYDVVRPLIWRDRSVGWWYRQNIYIYAAKSCSVLDSLEQFDPEFDLISNTVVNHLSLLWSSRAFKYVTALRKVRRAVSPARWGRRMARVFSSADSE